MHEPKWRRNGHYEVVVIGSGDMIQYNKHGYYISMSYSCGCCGTDTTAHLDEVMAEFDRVGAGVHTLYLGDYRHTDVNTTLLFSIHCEPRLGETNAIEIPMVVEMWIDDWRRKWRRKNQLKANK